MSNTVLQKGILASNYYSFDGLISYFHIRNTTGPFTGAVSLICSIPMYMKKKQLFSLFMLSCLSLLLSCSQGNKALVDNNPKTAKLKLQPGFKAEHLYSPSDNEQGSWVSMCFDDKDRMLASDQYGGIYRISIPDLTGSDSLIVEKIQLENDTLNFGASQGLLYAFNSLYVMVNNRSSDDVPKSSGLYRMQDTDGNDLYDKLTLLKQFEGAGEHGPHSIKLSPDGQSLYLIAGNHTDIPEMDSYRLPKTWEYDNLFPEIKDPRGHANSRKEPGGWIAKIDPEGKNWELVSAGYRNAFDMAFNDVGELFVYDADMEWDFGTPWYRPTRICHATSGSEFGWRTGDGKWSADFPDNLSPVINIGQGSPTNLLYLKGSNFPEKYQQSLLAFDWSFGIMHAIHLNPEGASYTAEREEFISGVPLPLTDGAIGPDGNLYFLTGGRRIESDLYRISYDGKNDLEAMETSEITEELALRRALESLHKEPSEGAIEKAWPNLKHPDRFVRYAARIVLEHQSLADWKIKALEETDAVTLTQAMIAMSRMGDKTLKEDIINALASIEMSELSESEQVDVLRAYELVFARMGKTSNITILTSLESQYPSKSYKVNKQLSKLLVFLDSPEVAGKTMAMIQKGFDTIGLDETATASSDLILRNPQYGLDIAKMLEKVPPIQETFFAMTLSQAKKGWTSELYDDYFSWYKNAFGYKGGNSYVGFIDKARNIALDNVPKTKREVYNLLSGAELLSGNGNNLVMDQYPEGPGRNWDLADAEIHFEEPLAHRDFEKGKSWYATSTCNVCHSINGEGGNIGPDLTNIGTRFTNNDLLEAILEPSKTISDQYAATEFQLNNGESIIAKIVSQDNAVYSVSQNPYDPNTLVEIKKSDVKNQQYSKISMMLPGLVNSLNEEELKDLVAFVMSGGKSENEVFN
ncbi:MAG: putative heme-binding domain-containing protein [Algoriphagus sp.]